MGGYAEYVLAGAVVVGLLGCERLWPASASQRGEWLNNATGFALSFIAQRGPVGLILMAETRAIEAMGGGLIDLRAAPWGLGAIVYLLAMDLGEYLFHRAQHAIPWMWAMHSLHHSDRAMNVTTTERHFWLDPALKAVTIWLAVAVLFKVDGVILTVYFLATFYNFLSHANVRLGFGALSWLLNSPQYHRMHHSREARHHNVNFAALFPIFDVLSGAYVRPARDEFPDTGLDEDVATPLNMVVWPVRGRARRATS